ncbi:MAG TPA: FGGY family carbohydrate kinase, partial [Thermomicrobiales bacterium]|nr:FGGY family carbohydrate kinase [Thermomicrobiales bacterium]
MPNVSLVEAVAPLVIAIDVGSSSVRTLVYDAVGNQVSGTEARSSHTLRADKDGASEADPDLLLDLLCRSLDRTLAESEARAGDLAAVGMSCFWHGLMGIDGEGAPTTPIYMWADKRAGGMVAGLASDYEPQEAVRLTGCRMHSSYWPAKLRWLRATNGQAFDSTSHWVSFPDYVSLKLTGSLRTSVSMASGTGLMSSETTGWFEPMIRHAKIEPAQLPEIFDRDQPLPPLLPEFGERWPPLSTIPWFPALGDGAAANVGAGCVGPDRIALTVGTSGAMRTIVPISEEHDRVPPGQLWVYRLDRHREVIGGALSNGGNVTAWLSETVSGRSMDDLTREAESVAPDGHGLTILPFLAGERSPSWDDSATGVFAGLTLATAPAELFRAILEATAYRFAAIHD